MNRKLLKQKIAANITKHILSKEIDDEINYNINPKFYHIITPEIADKISDLLGDDFTNIIGQYAFIALRGEPMSTDEILSFDDTGMSYSTLIFELEFQDLAGLNDLSKCHYGDLISDHGGLGRKHIEEMTRYTIMEEMEDARKKSV